MKKIINSSGIYCSHCANDVKKGLEKIENVKQANPSSSIRHYG